MRKRRVVNDFSHENAWKEKTSSIIQVHWETKVFSGTENGQRRRERQTQVFSSVYSTTFVVFIL